MAGDLDFKHNVQQIPAGPDIPEVKRSVGAEVSPSPNYQSAVSSYASNTNWMSAVGSAVATRASNAIATKLGGEAGKNPTGDLGLVLTDFDKTYAESYKTQAQATLGLQASELITNSNLEMAKAPRITPDLIASTHEQVSTGLQNIFKNAPSEIRPELEYTYGQQQKNQGAQLTERMIREGREDTSNTIITAAKSNAEVAFSLAMSDDPKSQEAAKLLVDSNNEMHDVGVNARYINSETSKVGKDKVRQSAESGKQIRLALSAEKEGKLGEYLKSLNEKIPGVSEEDHEAITKNVASYFSHRQSLRSQDDNLKAQNMMNQIASDPRKAAEDFPTFKSKVPPNLAAKVEFHLIQALNKKQTTELAQDTLIKGYGDSRVQANAEPKIKDATFNKLVANTMQSDPSKTLGDAELDVAKSAAAPAPVWTEGLKLGLWSGNAAQMLERSKQVDELQLSGNGHALTGLSEQDLALASDIMHNNNPADPAWSTRMVAENKLNQDKTVRENSQSMLNNFIYENTIKNGTNINDFILNKFGFGGGLFYPKFDSPWMASQYAGDILSVFKQNWINTRGDQARTDKLTNQYISDNFGKTMINGSSQWAKHPIEKALGFNEGEGIESINKDIIRQTLEPMAELKKKYDDNKTDHYWTVESESLKSEVLKQPNENTLRGLLANEKNNDQRLYFVKHTRNGVSTMTEKYPLKLVGNSFNWELNVETDDGGMSIFLAAPEIGVHKYTPDTKWIQNDYASTKGGSK